MSTKILIRPNELRQAAQGFRDGATAQSEVVCDLGAAIPEMPPDLHGRVQSTIATIKGDLGEQQAYMRREALDLERRVALARRADAGIFAFGIQAGPLGLGGFPALSENYAPPRPPAPKKKEKGNGLLNILGEVSGVNDAGKAIDDFGDGNILGGVGSLALALPTPFGKGAKVLKGGSKIVGGGKGGRKGDGVAKKPDKPGAKPNVDRSLERSRAKLDELRADTNARTLDAARRELKGEVVKRRPGDGKPYDHVQKVRNAQNGLLKQINSLKKTIADPATSPAQRAEAQTQLGEASRTLDHSEKFVPRH